MEYYAPVQGGASTFAGLEVSVGGDPSGAVLSSLRPEEWHLQHAVPSPGQGAETGLEEAVWQLSLQSPDDMDGAQGHYPERPGEPDCVYYMRTGLCSFGMTCRYNHPPNWKLAAAIARSKGEYPERPGQPECQYYLKTGTCKFGATCKYHHPRDKAGSAGRVQLNIVGLPLRQGEKECAYYMRTGACKYGVTCKFHHPQPTPISPLMPGSPLYAPSASPSTAGPQPYPAGVPWPLRSPYLHSPRLGPSGYAPMLIPPHQGIVSMPPGWTTYQGQASPIASPDGQHPLGTSFLYGSPHGEMQVSFGHHMGLPALQAPPVKDSIFPERPGQPECQYYLKTGDCKFGAACRYHHPRDRANQSSYMLSTIGLPLRPGAPPCTYYTRHGMCKFGSNCKFDHPLGNITYSPSASSLADMPVAPYPIGSSPTTLAPSSVSAELTREISTTLLKHSSSTSEDLARSGSEEAPSVSNVQSSSTSLPISRVDSSTATAT